MVNRYAHDRIGDDLHFLAREVQASRKLIARALHAAGEPPTPGFVLTFCDGCEDPWPCPTIQLIDAAELSS